MDVESLRVLTDKYTFEIISALDEFKTVAEVSNELDIPQATCYRRMSDLSQTPFIVEDEVVTINSTGNDTGSVYKRNIECLEIDFSQGFEVDLEVKD